VRSAKETTTLVDLVKSIFEIRKAVEPVDFLGTKILLERGGTMALAQKADTEALSTANGVQGACRALSMFPDCFSSLQATQP
jgi:hypothetical protein